MKENPTKVHLNIWKITALSTNKDMGYVLVEIIQESIHLLHMRKYTRKSAPLKTYFANYRDGRAAQQDDCHVLEPVCP